MIRPEGADAAGPEVGRRLQQREAEPVERRPDHQEARRAARDDVAGDVDHNESPTLDLGGRRDRQADRVEQRRERPAESHEGRTTRITRGPQATEIPSAAAIPDRFPRRSRCTTAANAVRAKAAHHLACRRRSPRTSATRARRTGGSAAVRVQREQHHHEQRDERKANTDADVGSAGPIAARGGGRGSSRQPPNDGEHDVEDHHHERRSASWPARRRAARSSVCAELERRSGCRSSGSRCRRAASRCDPLTRRRR